MKDTTDVVLRFPERPSLLALVFALLISAGCGLRHRKSGAENRYNGRPS